MKDLAMAGACGPGCMRSLFMFLTAAISTDTNHPQKMFGQLKFMFGGHRFLNCLQLRRVEFNNLPAFGANHVVMMLVLVIMLVVRAAIAKPDFPCQSRVRQQAQRAIYGSLPDRRILGPHQLIEVFTGNMTLSAQEHIENQVPLRGAFQALLLNMI